MLACLRKTDIKAWVNSPFDTQFTTLSYGSTFLPEEPATVLREGKANRIPIMVGNTEDEMELFTMQQAAAGTAFDDAQYTALLRDKFGAVHGSELPSLFGEHQFTPEQQQLSDQMIKYWSNFARTGEPDGAGLPRWEPDVDGQTVLGLAPGAGGIAPVSVNETYHCDLWPTHAAK